MKKRILLLTTLAAMLAAADGAWERRSFWAASASSTAYAYVPGKPAVETHRSFTGESVLGLTKRSSDVT